MQEFDNCPRTLARTSAPSFVPVCVMGCLLYVSVHIHIHADMSFLLPAPSLGLSLSHTATSSAHLEDLAYLDEQRHTPLRTSLRMPRQSTTCGPGRSGQDLRGEQQAGVKGSAHTQSHSHWAEQCYTHLAGLCVTDKSINTMCLHDKYSSYM